MLFQAGSEFRDSMLKRHNELRLTHGSAPLSIEANLILDAESYAKRLAQQQSPTPIPDPTLPKDIGENIYIKCGEVVNGESVTNIW